MEQAYKMAIDFLGLKLYDYYIKNQNYKIATDINKINVLKCLKERTGATDEELKNLDYFLTYIPVDLLKVLKQSDNRVTRKNVSIPIWLDKIGKNKNINFSKILTETLIEKLELKEDNNYIF